MSSDIASSHRGSTKVKAVGLIAAGVVLVAVAGCATGSGQPKAHATSPGPAAVETSGPPANPAHYALPQKLDGLVLSTDLAAADLANATRDDIAATLTELTSPATVGSYAGSGSDTAVLIGLPMTVDDPASTIDEIFNGLRSMDLYAIGNPTDRNISAPGASMKCADATVLGGHGNLRLGACVEAGPRGSAVLLRFTKSGGEAAAVLAGILPTFER